MKTVRAFFRGGKATYWEGGLRAAGFITSGNLENIGITAPGINRQLFHVSDWLPSLCQLAGCNMNGTKPLDGMPLWEAIAENVTSQRTGIVHDICFQELGGSCAQKNGAVLREGPWKIIINQDRGKTELYNVIDDPSETNDCSQSHPAEVNESV
jgi:arylsulfatase A-like enzyme